MEHVDIGDVELANETVGTGEPVVCIHGSLVADAFRPLVSGHGLERSYQMVLYYRRGYSGSSPLMGPVSFAAQAEDCRRLLAQLGFSRAHVVGHSYGGVIALQLALDFPEVVHSLSLLEPALAVGSSAEEYRGSLNQAMQRYREGDVETLVDGFLQARWPEYRSTIDREMPGAFNQAVADAATTFEHEFPPLLDWQFGEAEASRVEVPTLSLLGAESQALSPRFAETHRALQEWIPDCEGAVIPRVTHFLQMQCPAEVAAVLSAFWQRHPLRSEDRESQQG